MASKRLWKWVVALALGVVGGGAFVLTLVALSSGDYIAAKASVLAIETGSVFHVDSFMDNWGWMYCSMLAASACVVISGLSLVLRGGSSASVGLAVGAVLVSAPRVVDHLVRRSFRIWHWESVWIDYSLLAVGASLLVVVWLRKSGLPLRRPFQRQSTQVKQPRI